MMLCVIRAGGIIQRAVQGWRWKEGQEGQEEEIVRRGLCGGGHLLQTQDGSINSNRWETGSIGKNENNYNKTDLA